MAWQRPRRRAGGGRARMLDEGVFTGESRANAVREGVLLVLRRHAGVSLRQTFQAINSSRTGEISWRELQYGLMRLKVRRACAPRCLRGWLSMLGCASSALCVRACVLHLCALHYCSPHPPRCVGGVGLRP
jgi:hypothetical protein